MSRRAFAQVSTIGLVSTAFAGGTVSGGSITDVAGVRVGHFTDARRPTGCTVVLVEEGAAAGVDVRGSAPGTRETDLLDPINSVAQVHAVLLAGGSAFGLDAAGGVMRWLERKGIGFPTSVARVPIVPAAILFDLTLGDPSIRPDAEAGWAACEAARPGPVAEGNVGAGAGATVGKLRGMGRAMKGGLGTASRRAGNLVVGALAAVNAIGDIIDPENGRIVAGVREPHGGGFSDARKLILEAGRESSSPVQPGENTTLAVVATNAQFDKRGMTKVAQMAHDGLARTIFPAHLPFDGDTIFALSAGTLAADLGQVGALAALAVSDAVIKAVLAARGLPGLPAAADYPTSRR